MSGIGFTVDDLAALREVAEAFFTEGRFTLTQPVGVPNSMGGRLAGQEQVATGVAGLLRPKAREPLEGPQSGAPSARNRFEILVPLGTPVTVRGRVIDALDGAHYEILGDDRDRSQPATICIQAIRIDDGAL